MYVLVLISVSPSPLLPSSLPLVAFRYTLYMYRYSRIDPYMCMYV